MADLSLPARDSVAAQHELFRRAKVDHGLSIAVIAKRNCNLKASTMTDWSNGAVMPAWALGELKTAGIPDDLLTLLVAPYAAAFVSEPDEGDGDLDTAAHEALEFAGEVGKARHPKSLGGLVIVPQEKAVIVPKLHRACSSMRKAAA